MYSKCECTLHTHTQTHRIKFYEWRGIFLAPFMPYKLKFFIILLQIAVVILLRSKAKRNPPLAKTYSNFFHKILLTTYYFVFKFRAKKALLSSYLANKLILIQTHKNSKILPQDSYHIIEYCYDIWFVQYWSKSLGLFSLYESCTIRESSNFHDHFNNGQVKKS